LKYRAGGVGLSTHLKNLIAWSKRAGRVGWLRCGHILRNFQSYFRSQIAKQLNAGSTQGPIVIVEISGDADAAPSNLRTRANPGGHFRSSVHHDPIPNLRDLLIPVSSPEI